MVKPLTVAVVLSVLSGQGSQAFDCCDSYTDLLGDYHPSVLCLDYCCWTIGAAYKGCCSNILRMIPSSTNKTEECVQHWIIEHRLVPLLISVFIFWFLQSFCDCFTRILRY